MRRLVIFLFCHCRSVCLQGIPVNISLHEAIESQNLIARAHKPTKEYQKKTTSTPGPFFGRDLGRGLELLGES